MTSSWQTESGHLTCCWSDVRPSGRYDSLWIHDHANIPSGYLRPLPDFANHSPFGGVSWFQPNPADRDND